MKKLLTVLSLLLCFALPVFAAGADPVADDADLLTASQEDTLTQLAEDFREQWDMDMVIVTADDVKGMESEEYADFYYDSNGYGIGPGYDGILLLIDMENRVCAISTCGEAKEIFTDGDMDYILDEVIYYLSDGDYHEGAATFIQLCDDICLQMQDDIFYDIADTEDMTEDSELSPVSVAIISLVAGLIVALIATGIMRSKLKTVRAKNAAADYLKPGSLNLTESRDLFLYRNVTRRERPKQNSGGGSIGRSHGGRSRGF